MRLRHQQAGLTLLEILIALSIFSMIGVTSFRLLDTAVSSEKLSKTHSAELNQIQKSLAVINRDLQYFADREIRQGNESLASLIINQNYALEFSKAGWRNPLLLDRSQLQRVAYSVGDHPAKDDKNSRHHGSDTQYLLRHYWSHLDRPSPNDGIFTQVLLANVSGLSVEVITDKGQYTLWPKAKSTKPGAKPEQLLGLNFAIAHDTLGDIARTYRLN